MLDTSTTYRNRIIYYRTDEPKELRTDSSDPRLKRVPHLKVHPDGTITNQFGVPIKMHVTANGYLATTIGNLGAVKTFPVHRLVLYSYSNEEVRNYIDQHPEIQVNHIDGNKLKNAITNLEWCSPQENVEHAIRTGLRPPAQSYQSKEQIMNDFRNGMTLTEACEKYKDVGASKSTLQSYKKEAVGLYDVYDYAREKEFVANALNNGMIPQRIYEALIQNGFNVSESWVFRLCHELGYVSNRTDFSEHYAEIEKMIQDGVHPYVIADMFNLKPATVMRFANRRLGVYYRPDNSELKAEIKEKLANGVSVSEIMEEYGNKVGKSTVEEWRRQIFGKKTDHFIPSETRENLIADIQSGMNKPDLYKKYDGKMSSRSIRNYYNEYSPNI